MLVLIGDGSIILLVVVEYVGDEAKLLLKNKLFPVLDEEVI